MKIQTNYYNSINFNGHSRKIVIGKEELETLISQGYNFSQIAKMHNLSYECIRKNAQRYGLISYNVTRKATLINDLFTLLQNGKSIKEIAEQFKCSITYVYKLLPKVMDKETFQQIKEFGLNKRVAQKKEELRKCYKNNKDVQNVYDSFKGHRLRLQKAEQEIRCQIRFNKTSKLVKNALAQISQGGSVSAAARELGIPQSTLLGYLDNKKIKEAKIEAKSNKLEVIKELVKEGLNIKQIANHMQHKRSYIARFVGEFYPNWREDLVRFRMEKINGFLKQGLTYEQIADVMNISKDTVKRTIRACKK